MKLIPIAILILCGISCSIRNDRWSEQDALVIASYSDPKAIQSLLELGERHKSAQGKLSEVTLVRIAELCNPLSISNAISLLSNRENATTNNESKIYYYQEALKLNPNSLEALNGICTYLRDSNQLELRLDQWKQADPSNSLPYYLKASIVIDYDKPKATAELMKGNSLKGIIYRPLYQKLRKQLSASEMVEARTEFYMGDLYTNGKLTMLQMKLTANNPSQDLLLDLLIFDNHICSSIPHDSLNMARGALKGLGILQSLTSHNVLSDTLMQSEYALRTNILEQVRKNASPETAIQNFLKSIEQSSKDINKLLSK